MFVTAVESKGSAKIRSIAQKLEAINRISNIVLAEVAHFSPPVLAASEKIDYYEEIERFEIELIRFALFQAKGNQRRAAKILNIKPTTLNAKVRKFNLSHTATEQQE